MWQSEIDKWRARSFAICIRTRHIAQSLFRLAFYFFFFCFFSFFLAPSRIIQTMNFMFSNKRSRSRLLVSEARTDRTTSPWFWYRALTPISTFFIHESKRNDVKRLARNLKSTRCSVNSSRLTRFTRYAGDALGASRYNYAVKYDVVG